MAGMVTDAQYNIDAQIVKDITGRVPGQITSLKAQLDQLVTFKTTYPNEVVELDGYITWVKQQCQSIINEY